MNNKFQLDHSAAVLKSRELLAKNPVYIDTETTGIDDVAQIIDIAVVDSDGTILINTLIKPTAPIPAGATAIHHITDKMVYGAPTWAEAWPLVNAILRDRLVITYNADYDIRMIRQSCKAHGIGTDCKFQSACAMLLFADFYGDFNEYRGSYRWKKLDAAAKIAGYQEWVAHRAVGDTLATLAVMHYMAKEAAE